MVGITNGNYGIHVGNRIYANLRPYAHTRYDRFPDYSYSPIYYSTLIVHEFAHSIINPMTAAYADRITQIPLEKHTAALDNFCYGDSVETLINETVISALECLYVNTYFSEHYERYVQEYENDGFRLLRPIMEILKNSTDIHTDYHKVISLF